jgi:hypothetical protein
MHRFLIADIPILNHLFSLSNQISLAPDNCYVDTEVCTQPFCIALANSESRSTYAIVMYHGASRGKGLIKLFSLEIMRGRAIRRTERLAPMALVHVCLHSNCKYVPYVNHSTDPNPSYQSPAPPTPATRTVHEDADCTIGTFKPLAGSSTVLWW